MASQNEVVYTEIAKIDRQSIVNIIGVCNFVDNYRIERPTGVPNIHFDIFDKNGDGIRVYAFYELAKGILNRVQLNKTYAITSVSVQPKDPYFNYLHEFKELIVTSHTKIMEVREDGMVVLPPRKEYEIIALNEVPVGQNVGFAVMGKLTWVGSLRFIDTRWEENIAIVNVRLIDKYGGECNLSILGKSAHEVTVKDLGCVVVVSGVRARNYEGKLSLRSLPNVKITVYRHLKDACYIQKKYGVERRNRTTETPEETVALPESPRTKLLSELQFVVFLVFGLLFQLFFDFLLQSLPKLSSFDQTALRKL